MLRRIQRRVGVIISRVFKDFIGDTLDVLCYLQLVEFRLEQAITDAFLRLRSGPNYAVIKDIRASIELRRPLIQAKYFIPLLTLIKRQMDKEFGIGFTD